MTFCSEKCLREEVEERIALNPKLLERLERLLDRHEKGEDVMREVDELVSDALEG